MKRHLLILLATIFALASISLVIIQISQTKKAAKMSENLFYISVNNAIEKVFTQLDRMKIEDYVSQKERQRLQRFLRIDDLNEKMQDLIRSNSELFYDESRVKFGISTQDSALSLPESHLSRAAENTLTQYNTLLNARNRLIGDIKQNPKTNSPIYINSTIDATKLNFPLLDSLICEELVINGVDITPYIGVWKDGYDTLLYCSENAHPSDLLNTAYKYTFHPHGISSDDNLYLLLSFPPSPMIFSSGSNLYTFISIFMILLISFLFVFSLRTISSQRKLDEMKTDFINNMTHEIKTPIATIGLACEMLEDNSINSDVASRNNFINIISDENRRMRVLIETLLQSAKMSGKKYTINLKEIDLNRLVETSVQNFNLTIQNRQGVIETHLGDISSTLFADELHISNLIHNLIDNAIKYSDKAPHVVITTLTKENFAILQVTDHGIGIAKEDQPHIFEKFYRVSTGNIHNVKGFGIGLNYVSQVVALHRGTISLNSELGQGSTFTVSLPLD